MTYRELLTKLQSMDDARLDDTVTVFEPYEEEYVAVVEALITTDECDVLDAGHLFLTLKA